MADVQRLVDRIPLATSARPVFAWTTTQPAPPENTTIPFIPLDPPPNKCNYYVKNSTVVVFDFANQYGGIPQNLAFNAIGWAILVLLFAFLRRTAGNYGRLALIRKDDDESKWTQLFFAPDEADPALNGGFGAGDDFSGPRDSLASIDFNELDSGVCSWVTSVFTLNDDKYLRKCGVDAVQYLRFQRHLILFIFIMTVVCIAIILPVNFQGEVQGTKVDFGHTTISNLQGFDERLWIHIVFVILFLPIGIAIMRRFSVNLNIVDNAEDDCPSSRTIMIVGVPEAHCTKEILTRHFHEAYPDFEIDDVQIAYDVSKLSALDIRRELARRSRIYCENLVSKHGSGEALQMRPWACGIMCCCCSTGCCQPVDALSFYQREEQELTQEVEREKARIKTRSIGMAFVTMTRLEEARVVLRDHRARCGTCCTSAPPVSTLSIALRPHRWSVRTAPPPEDIYWENLNDSHRFFFVKALFINFFVFFILFFFTSPAYIISQLELFLNFKNFSNNDKINDFLPTLMLWTLSALLPIVVAYSDWAMGHWSRSHENLWIMRKVFFYLLFMVLILPSVGLTTLRGLFELFVHSASNTGNSTANGTDLGPKWSCIFLPDNGSFFVNYVITSALVGTALELMRFSELFMYAMRLMVSRSVAETPSVRKANLYEFPFGFNYGWMLLIFALTSAYAVICPLITPFGLFYMIMKHGVDRYNLYYAYKRSKINKNMHATAVNCVIVSLLIQQLVLLFFNVVRAPEQNKIYSPRVIFSATMLAIFTMLFIAQMFFHVLKGVSPLQYKQPLRSRPSSSSSPRTASGSVRDLGSGDASGVEDTSAREDEDPTSPSDLGEGYGTRLNQPQKRKRRHKQFVPDVLRRDVFSAVPLVLTESNAGSSSSTMGASGGIETTTHEFTNDLSQPLQRVYGATGERHNNNV